MLIYENIHGDLALNKVAALYGTSYRVRDWGSDVPHAGVFHGSIEGCNWMRENRPHVKVWATFENYLCSAYYPQIQDLLFNDRYVFIPFKDLSRRKWDLYAWLGKHSTLFIRPDSGEKDFPAELVDIQNIDDLTTNYDYEGLAVVSTPKNFVGEWRFVVSSEGVHAVSLYRYQGISSQVPAAPPAACTFVEKVLALGVNPDILFCIDVVQDVDGAFWVMELTSFSSAGLYACDPQKIANLIKKHENSPRT